jgi:membrane associated rhomboid family serine protease
MYQAPRGFSILPPVIKNLIILNGIVYLFFAFSTIPVIQNWMMNYLALQYPSFFGGANDFYPHQLITYMFLHDPSSLFHLFFNMFALWMFGAAIENIMGSKRFLSLYLVSGIGAGIIHLIVTYAQLSSPVPVVGASGAIYGILFAYAYYFPNQPIYLYFFIPVKAKYLMAGLILIDLFSGLTGGGDVAHFAHLGGVLSGWLFLNVYRLKRIKRRF